MSPAPNPSSPDGVSQTVPHPQYFIPSGDTDILVQNILFRVHRYFFQRESPLFNSTFAVGRGKPYTLDVAPDDFAHFLWVIYDEEYDYDNQPLDKWLVILGLATRWDFQKIRKLAVRQLEKMKLKPIQKIKIYSDFKIDAQLLIPSYTTLVASPTVPSLKEAEQLDIDTILKLMVVRERALQKAAADGVDSPTSASIGDAEINKIICDTFELPNLNTTPNSGSSDDLNGTASQNSDKKTTTMGKSVGTESRFEQNGKHGNAKQGQKQTRG